MHEESERNAMREVGTSGQYACRSNRPKDWKTILRSFQLEAHHLNPDNVMKFLNNLIM